MGSLVHRRWECKMVRPLWKKVGRLPREQTCSCPVMPQVHCQASARWQGRQGPKHIVTHQCPEQQQSRQLKGESVQWQMNGWAKCSLSAHRNVSQLWNVKVLAPAPVGMHLEDMMLRDGSRSQNDKCCTNPLRGATQDRQVHGARTHKGAQELGERERGLVFDGDRVSLRDDGKFWRRMVVKPAQHCECT